MGLLRKHKRHLRKNYALRRNIGKSFWKGEIKMSEFQDFFNEQLQNKEFRKEYEDLQPEFDVIRAMLDARTARHMTQKELAEKTGINQADISKLENGTRNPSLKLLKRLADGMDMELKISFIPKRKTSV